MAVLDYQRQAVPSMKQALLLCAPGALCEAFVGITTILMNFNALSQGSIPHPIKILVLPTMALLFLAAAVTAIVSLVRYGWHPLRRKPWYVYLNLAVNGGGMLYCAAAVVYAVIYGFGQD
jgi:RsiW-degrading membrane proteinase PrsW (M82 family)